MKKYNKNLWLGIISAIVGLLLVIGIFILVNFIRSDSNTNDNNRNENKNNVLGLTHKLIDYRISECFDVNNGIVCSATNYTNGTEEFLIQIDSNSNIVWEKSIYANKEMNDKSFRNSLSCNENGTCAFANDYTNAPKATEGGMLTLFDNQGNRIWEIDFLEEYRDFYVEDLKITDDAILIVGIYSDGNQNYNGFIFKYDLNGKLIWKTTYNKDDGNGFYSINVSKNGNIYVAGYINQSNSSISKSRGLLVKFNKDGKVSWEKTYKDEQVSSDFYDILVTEEEKIIVLGERDKAAQNLTQQTIILNFDSEGNEIVEKIYTEEQIEKIYLNTQNSVIGYGIREENKYANKEKQIMILNIDANFNIISKSFLDISKYEFIIDVTKNQDNWLIMALTKDSNDKTAIINIKGDRLFDDLN